MDFETCIQNDSAALMAVFGVPAVLADGISPTKDIRLVFDGSSIDQMGVLTDKPQASLLTVDLEGINLKTAIVTVKDINYRLLKPLPDGYGLTLVTLARD